MNVLVPVVLVVECKGTEREVSAVSGTASVAAEAGHWGVILSGIGDEEVVKHDVNRRAGVYDVKVATRRAREFAGKHVVLVTCNLRNAYMS